jgi:hypothetical protein
MAVLPTPDDFWGHPLLQAETTASSPDRGDAAPGRARLTVETTVSPAHQEEFYQLYLGAFSPLRTRAAARQVLHRHEFLTEMADPRVLKYVVWDADGEPQALSTLTSDLATVPWISPEYFAHRYPEQTARDAVYYWGFVLARPDRRSSMYFRQILVAIVAKMAAERAVCAYDICAFNNDSMRFAQQIETVTRRLADVTVEVLDTQTYYGATF